ncbi:hypothetical protein [Bacillus bombysepticus]|uniref:hypothetical protein n=1 Tax=Bacillus bombysepticus TaxID=658666 RepID=UPI00301A0308
MKNCEVIKKIGDVLVIKVYAMDEESRVYGDVHMDKSLIERINNDTTILQGFGVIDERTYMPMDPFESWYDSVDDALTDIERYNNPNMIR